MENYAPEPRRKVGLLLGLGIFLMPYIFSWFTLRRGHTTTARAVSFVWLGILLLGMILTPPPKPQPESYSASDTQKIKTNDAKSDKITLAKFNQLRMGMSYSEAVSILGKSGTETAENQFGDIRTKVYNWDCGFMCGIDLYFQNGELTQKNQFGLVE